jgi:hypothetical protein
VTQLDLFGPQRARRKLPWTPERLTSIAVGVWRASKPVAGTLGERLFRDLRLDVPGPDVVRFHHALKRGDERCPGLCSCSACEASRAASFAFTFSFVRIGDRLAPRSGRKPTGVPGSQQRN